MLRILLIIAQAKIAPYMILSMLQIPSTGRRFRSPPISSLDRPSNGITADGVGGRVITMSEVGVRHHAVLACTRYESDAQIPREGRGPSEDPG